jgi:hypothetical protein
MNELQKYHTTKCNTHFRIFFYSQLVILGLWLLTWLTWFLPGLTLPIAVCQLALLSQVKVKVTLRLTVGQSVCIGVEPQLLLFDSYGLVFVGRPLWREDGSVFCICSWSSPAQSFSGPSPLDLATIFYCLSFVGFETSLFVASYDSQGHGGGIRPRLHTGHALLSFFCPLIIAPLWRYSEHFY